MHRFVQCAVDRSCRNQRPRKLTKAARKQLCRRRVLGNNYHQTGKTFRFLWRLIQVVIQPLTPLSAQGSQSLPDSGEIGLPGRYD